MPVDAGATHPCISEKLVAELSLKLEFRTKITLMCCVGGTLKGDSQTWMRLRSTRVPTCVGGDRPTWVFTTHVYSPSPTAGASHHLLTPLIEHGFIWCSSPSLSSGS